MTSVSSLKTWARSLAILSILTLAATAQTVAPSFHLAYGVDTSTTSANYNKLVVRDLHGDHYHGFNANNGTDPDGHLQMPLTIGSSGGFASLSLAAWNDSPYATNIRYAFPTGDEAPAFDIHLELVSVSSANLIVQLQHDDHYHTLSAGDEGEHLHFGEFQDLRFSFTEGAALGNYTAVFRIVDEFGTYTTSNNFTVHVSAVPEPSSAAALAGLISLGFVALRRRRR